MRENYISFQTDPPIKLSKAPSNSSDSLGQACYS